MFQIDLDTCFICNEQLQSELKVITIKQKAINTLQKLSTERKDGFSEYLSGRSEIKLHTNCLKEYSESPLESTENTTDGFPFEKLCFICGQDAGPEHLKKEMKKRQGKRNLVSVVERESTKLTILDYVANHPTSEYQIVVDRIKNVELEKRGRYHYKCYQNISISKERQRPLGRPVSDRISASMAHAFDYIDSSGDTYFFLKELCTVIEDSCEYVPDRRTLKAKLKERYKDTISFCITPRNNTLITIKDPDEAAQEVPYWNSQEERMKIVKKAAKIIRYDVVKVEPELPVSLNAFIEILATLDKEESTKKKVSETIAVYVENC